MPLAFWLSRGRCPAVYPASWTFDAPRVRCARRVGHKRPHRAPFGLEWE